MLSFIYLECPNIEKVWLRNREFSNRTSSMSDFILSHSDAGPYIHIMCPEGYHVIGPSVITCLEGGVWGDDTEPTCSCKLHITSPFSYI